jgi:hypothetical protein
VADGPIEGSPPDFYGLSSMRGRGVYDNASYAEGKQEIDRLMDAGWSAGKLPGVCGLAEGVCSRQYKAGNLARTSLTATAGDWITQAAFPARTGQAG